jgi:hypothetical protein
MAVAEEQRTDENQSGDEGHTGAALKAAGAAAATGAAAYAVQRALSNRSKNGSDDEGESREKGESQKKKGKSRGSGTLLASAASGGWDAARDTIMPLAEDAAGAAGKYLAERAPDFVSDRIVPKFIEGFNEARR